MKIPTLEFIDNLYPEYYDDDKFYEIAVEVYCDGFKIVKILKHQIDGDYILGSSTIFGGRNNSKTSTDVEEMKRYCQHEFNNFYIEFYELFHPDYVRSRVNPIYDKNNVLIQEFDLVRVKEKTEVRVYVSDNKYDLRFIPYGKEEPVYNYKSEDLEVVLFNLI